MSRANAKWLKPCQNHGSDFQLRNTMKSGKIGLPYTPRGPISRIEIHAHRVAAERKEGRVAEAQNAAVSPDQIDRQRQQRVAEILADQGESVGGEVKIGEDAGTTRLRIGTSNNEQGKRTQKPRSPNPCRALIHSVYWGGMATGFPTRGRSAGRVRAAGSE